MKEDERLKLIKKTTLEEASIEDILTDDSEGEEEMEVDQGNIIQPEDMDQGLSENEDWFSGEMQHSEEENRNELFDCLFSFIHYLNVRCLNF